MFKWFLGLAALALLAVFFVWQRDSVKTSYVNGLPAYRALPNREFVFEHDCYIFKLKDRNTDWPLVGAQMTIPGLPAEVAEAKVGSSDPEIRLLDVVRAGSRFKVISVRRDESRRGTFITFEILFLDAQERKYPRLDAFYLLDHSPEKTGAAPTFLEGYAVPNLRK